MPKIDPQKLRRFHSDARAAHGGLLAASAEVRRCREDLAIAKAAMDRAKPGSGAEAGWMSEGSENMSGMAANGRIHAVGSNSTLRDAATALKAAETALTRSLDHEEEARERWEHAQGLWARCRAFAAAHGALPADLND